jgi:prolyl-tRNA synthetase
MYLTPAGEDTLLICEACGYSANRQIALFQKPAAPPEDLLPLEEVATPGAKTIQALADFLGVPKSRTAKAVFMMADLQDGQEVKPQLVFAIVRGDMEVNETKLLQAVKAKELRPAREEEIIAAGAVPGYASPVDLRGVTVVVDDSVAASPNLVAGANKEGYHLRNVNYGRDYQASLVADIAAADEGSLCPQCGQQMIARRGVEVGNIFQLGTRYTEAMGAYYQDRDGQSRPVVMGSYGIGSGRLLACIAEEHHDQNGLIWPITVAPYQVHLVVLMAKERPADSSAVDSDPISTADRLYGELQDAGYEVLYDDRTESPGVKFKDADLIGVPIRLTVSERSLGSGGVEFKRRDLDEKLNVPFEEVFSTLKAAIQALQAEIDELVIPVPYNE